MTETPILEVEATFLTREQGGRNSLPSFKGGWYKPHLVVQPSEVRTVATDGNTIIDDYLGVAFVSGPETLVAGKLARFNIKLWYYPEVNYDSLEEGATFTIREGSTIVGYGRVIRRM